MKRFLSLLLVSLMILSSMSSAVLASPENKCYSLNTNGSYVFFYKAVNPTNSSISFDMSMASNSEGAPYLSINGNVIITPSMVSAGGASSAIEWGETELTHWKKVDVSFTSTGCTVSLDGEPVHIATGVQGRNDGVYFIGFPGDFLFDNVVLTSDGTEIAATDFSNKSTLLNSDSSGVYTNVPADSYYDFEDVELPDNAEYIFDSSDNCAVLTVGSEENILVGDLNLDGKVNARDTLSLKRVNVNALDIDVRLVDFDYNGIVNTKDSLFLKRTAAGTLEPVYKTYGSLEASEYDAAIGAAKLTAAETVTEGIDATLNMVAVNAEDYKYAVITYMTPNSSENSNSEAAVESAFGAYGNFAAYDLNTDGKFHSAIVDLSQISTWTGNLATLRFFTLANAGDTIYIDSIVFTATKSRAVAVQSVREAAKKGITITDAPELTGLGYYEGSNYVVPFDSEERVSYVSNSNNSSIVYDEKENALKATATAGADPSVYVDLTEEGISASTFKYLVYTYKVPTSVRREGPSANMYYVCGSIDVPTGGYECELFSARKGDVYFSQIIDLSAKSNWNGAIKGIRIDYFSDCFAGDCAFIDSLVFCKSLPEAKDASNERLQERNGALDSGSITPAAVWNTYRMYYLNMNNYEYIGGSSSSPTMYFKFNSDISKFSARSLADRFARAITEATGYEVTCKIYNGYQTLVNSWSNTNPNAYVHYVINYNGTSYVIYLSTVIIKDSSYTDVLDRTADDVDPIKYNIGSWNSDEVEVSAATPLDTTGATIGYHSNHECRIVKTPYGTFAVYPVKENGGFSNIMGGATFNVYRIYDDGSYKVIGTYDMTNHTAKPQIVYGNGLVYILCGDDQGDSSYCSLFTGYFDPSKPNADGSYNIIAGRTNRNYAGGATPGGYGYSDPVLDEANNKIYYIFNSGRDELGYYIAWFIYDMNTHTWETTGYNANIANDYRHCYIYAYPDGNGGIYFVGGRACLLECVGLKGIVYNVEYAWDRVSLIHLPNVRSGRYTQIIVKDGDYTQMDRAYYPSVANNNNGDAFISSDGYIHVLTSGSMHGNDLHDFKYGEQWHSIYKISEPGAEPELLYQEPITYGDTSTGYVARFVQSEDGSLYLIAMPEGSSPRVEVWKATNEIGSEFELVASKVFTGMGNRLLTSIVITSNRNGSENGNVVSCMYPAESGSGNRYYYFTVTLK